jgi:hypothetical protein
MTELLADLDVLMKEDLDLSGLSLEGVPFGASARVVPRERVRFADGLPWIRRSFTRCVGAPTQYFDEHGCEIPLASIVAQVTGAHGTLGLDSSCSFAVVDGLVRGFAITGERLHRHFSRLRTHDDFIAAFGAGGRVEESVVEGDLMGYWHRYPRTPKVVYWDEWDHCITIVSLGEFVRRGERR